MMQQKRSTFVSYEKGSFASLTPKRHKPDHHISISSSKERKEKVGERIAALQQLVSPFGKTDTASVLLEAMEYINFLHEQVKVLSAPYLQSTTPSSTTTANYIQEPESYNLRSKGLCLVPISSTAGVASSNGADIWAPIKDGYPKFE
ncbi:hypothetical protein LguiA_029034 [Lonicera macranthoides]